MDGSFPLRREPGVASPPPDVAEWQREIAEARDGLRAKVGTKAAAYYLGVHPKTLLGWVRGGSGPDPIKNPVRPGTTAMNQHFGFTLAALDAFQQARTGAVLTRGSRTDADALRREAERIQAAIDLKVAQDQLAKARERAKRLGVVCFATLSDAMEVHPWVQVDERLVGHLWLVGDEVFEQTDPDGAFEGTLEQALAQPWASEANRQPFHDAMLQVLATTHTELEDARTRQRGKDLEARLGPAGPARDRTTL